MWGGVRGWGILRSERERDSCGADNSILVALMGVVGDRFLLGVYLTVFALQRLRHLLLRLVASLGYRQRTDLLHAGTSDEL